MKKLIALILLFVVCFSFASCGDSAATGSDSSSEEVSGTDTTSDTNATDTSSSDTEEVWEPVHVVDNMVLAGDQYHQKVIVYNLDGLEPGDDLEFGEEWSYTVGISHIAGLKYREDTVFGDVILVAAGATNGQAQMISYPEGKVLWSTKDAGNNPHCIEILPSGNIAVASSTGGTVRLFKTSALLTGDTSTAATYEDILLYSAHGLVYDPKYEVLWGLGNTYLEAYDLVGEGASEQLVKNEDLSAVLPTGKLGGHALSADLTDPDYLYLSVNDAVFRFNKTTKEFITNFEGNIKINRKGVKGITNNQNGNFVLAIPNGGKGTKWESMGYGGWCTDTLTFCYYKTKNMFYAQSIKSADGSAFYKVITFYGKYQ